jgi:CDP-glycerol glycerophosphotransferase (TagB/SpsB family)
VLAARLYLFTHVLYRGPRPRGRRLVVNLWHGDGPKVTVPARYRRAVPASHSVVSGTRRWGEAKAEAFGLRSGDVWVTGNPRIDEMAAPASDASLRLLGLDPDLPVILWAPTFRQAAHAEVQAWADSADVHPFDEVLRSEGGIFAQLAREGRVQVVVKPHPLDPTPFRADGLTAISDRQLEDAGTDTYRFMARCRALITDYSSIWTDFAVLDRPIVLFCPDLDRYGAGRGFTDGSIVESAPGPVVTAESELLAALRRIAAGEDVGSAARHRVCARLGVVLEFGATERLMASVLAHLPQAPASPIRRPVAGVPTVSPPLRGDLAGEQP